MDNNNEHKTSTAELVEQYFAATNPVTKGTLRSIIANRLGITEQQDKIQRSNVWAIRERMRKFTYSFESRTIMEDYFKDYQGLD